MKQLLFNHRNIIQSNKYISSSWNYESVCAWLLFFFIIANCFQLIFIPRIIPKTLHWGVDLYLLLWFVYEACNCNISTRFIREYRFLWLFVILVVVSMVNAFVYYDQSIDQSFRVINPWFEYLFVFWLSKYKIRVDSLYYAIFVFSFLSWGLWLYIYFTGNLIIDFHVSEADLEGARGIERIKISGGAISTLFVFWSMGKYVKYSKNIYLLIFVISSMFTLFSVSRQHIVSFFVVSLLFFFRSMSLFKKIILIIVTLLFFYIVLPKITIYQRLSELTEEQLYNNSGMKEDVRTLAAKYYISQFEQPVITRIFGNCKYHSDSPYGNRVNYVIRNKGYILSDIGFVGIYIYFGLVGVFIFGYILFWTWHQKTDNEYSALKYMVYYLFLGNILSHSLETTTLILPIALYLIGQSGREKCNRKSPQEKLLKNSESVFCKKKYKWLYG